jgi:hypothetical protein
MAQTMVRLNKIISIPIEWNVSSENFREKKFSELGKFKAHTLSDGDLLSDK